MAQTVTKTAKTVEKAVQAALEELGVPEERVDYEVLEHPTKGLFGILGGKPAKVRVTVRDGVSPYAADDAPAEGSPGAAGSASSWEEAPHAPAPYPLDGSPAPSGADAPSGTAPQESAGYPAARPGADREEPAAPAGEEAIPEAHLRVVERAKAFLGDVLAAMRLEGVEIQERPTESGWMVSLAGEDLGILIGKHGQTLDALQYLANLAANRDSREKRVRIMLDVENYRDRREETLKRLAKRLADRALRTRQEIKLEPMSRHERKIIHIALQDNRRISTYSDGEEPYRYVVIAPKKKK